MCFLFSTCVDEALLCKGIPLCENKNDLKACKMNLPNMNWTHIKYLSTCTPIDHPEYKMPFGQTVDNAHIADHSQYNCLNRGDEDPFLIMNNESNETESKTWRQWLNIPCDKTRLRRCLGSRPDRCVDASGKHILVNIKLNGICINKTFIKTGHLKSISKILLVKSSENYFGFLPAFFLHNYVAHELQKDFFF